MKRKLTRSALFGVLKSNLRKAPDARNQRAPNFRYPIEQAGMSAFGAFYLQHESLASHGRALECSTYQQNFRDLFHENPISEAATVRNILDPVESEHFADLFSNVLNKLDRSAMLPSLRFSNQIGVLLAGDGVDYFTSTQVSCKNCSKAVHKRDTDGEYTQYTHKMFNVGIVHPSQNYFIPLFPEFILPQDGHKKQDCEQVAARRWLKRFRSRHRQLKVTMQFDALHANHGFLTEVKNHKCHFIAACKPGSQKSVYAWTDTAREQGDLGVYEERIKVKGRYVHRRYEFYRDVPIRDTNDALRVDWVQMTETDPRKKKPTLFAFVTDHRIREKNVVQIVEAGRKRWKVENEGHNTLKNQGYYFDHNYGHGKQYLSANIATLILYSFLIHTLMRLIDQDGLARLYAKTIRREVIDLLRHTLFILRVRNWEELYRINLETYDSS